MKIYQLRRSQFLPISQFEAWDFFSSPKNLVILTPKKLNFKIQSISGGDKIYQGQIISYNVSVLPFIRMRWVSEITHVHYPDYFADDQRSGPYTVWHHKHHFRAVEGGVEMTDELDYAIPYGILGRLAQWIFVEREVNTIFDYRNTVLKDLFKKK